MITGPDQPRDLKQNPLPSTPGFQIIAVGQVAAVAESETQAVISAEPSNNGICHEAWDRLQAGFSKSQEQPNQMPPAHFRKWRHTQDFSGSVLSYQPKRIWKADVTFLSEGKRSVAQCYWPVEWEALDSKVSVSIDPALRTSGKICVNRSISGGCDSSVESVGGLIRHQNGTTATFKLAWNFKALERKPEEMVARRNAAGIPDSWNISYRPALADALAAGAVKISAIGLVAVESEGARFWVLPPQGESWSIHAGEAQEDPSSESMEKKIQRAAEESGFAGFSNARVIDAKSGAELKDPAVSADQIIEEIYQDRFGISKSFVIEVLWDSGADGLFLSDVKITRGDSSVIRTQPAQSPK